VLVEEQEHPGGGSPPDGGSPPTEGSPSADDEQDETRRKERRKERKRKRERKRRRSRSPVPRSAEAADGEDSGGGGGGRAKRQRPGSDEVPEGRAPRRDAAAKRGKGPVDRSRPYSKYERRDKAPGHQAFPSVGEVERMLEERDALRRRRDWAAGDALQERLKRELNVHILDKQRLWGVGGVKWRESAAAAATGGSPRQPADAGAPMARSASLPGAGPVRPSPVLAGAQPLRLGGGLARQPSRLPGEPDDKVILDYTQGNHYAWSKWLGVLNTSESSSGKSRAEAISTARDPKRHDRSTRRELWRSQHPEFRAKYLPIRTSIHPLSHPKHRNSPRFFGEHD